MILTEEEAKTKWCPAARGYEQQSVGQNRDAKDRPLGKCLASGCMAWRWAPGKSPDQVASWDPCKTGPKGYCGL